ncbi:MAG TPA: DUF1343 domain-containing protein [Cytophagales bacterium]|nr:DUF1343 domain-containing protein [Cytophagales bacterium]
MFRYSFFFSILFLTFSCLSQSPTTNNTPIVGAERPAHYLPLLKDKKVAIIVNQTSRVGKMHLLDYLLSKKINVVAIFSPEHGFRGDADAGELVNSEKDAKSGINVISLYGENKKPKTEHLRGIDIVVFDIQDVGARFFTYLSTMHYAMEACAENKKSFIVLDRPNPNGDVIGGPVLEPQLKSFVGLHPIPIVHGMTMGELANMINAEKWLKDGIACSLKVIPCLKYTHSVTYNPPVKPSPNLPNLQAIRLYPSLCLFEGTVVSVGRGTESPFQVIGVPDSSGEGFSFTPKSIPGMAKKPLYEGKKCVGEKLDKVQLKGFDPSYLIKYYQISSEKDKFFNGFFNKLAGNTSLQEQIKQGVSKEEILASWQKDIEKFKAIRKKHLLYPDFE